MSLAAAALVALAATGGGATVTAPDPVLVRAGQPVTITAQVAPGDAARLRWFVAEPVVADYDNLTACSDLRADDGCHVPIRYRRIELPELAGRATVAATDVPALAGLGTHRVGAWTGAAPPALDEDTVAALLPVVVRRDDTYTGYLTELLGVPFVHVPRRVGGRHQTDARLGADCVALVVYGRRRLGDDVVYQAPRALARRLEPVARLRAGDVIHYGFQTAVVFEDRAPLGELSDDDLVIHTFHGVAELARVGELPYRSAPHELLRWPARHPF